MSPLIAYHVAPRRYRQSIERYGLLPNLPTPANFYGVYVYCDDHWHPTWRVRRDGTARMFRLQWEHRAGDLWEVAYIGPVCPDPFVANGLILTEPVQFASLVSHLSRVTF